MPGTERITAPKVMGILEDHLHLHEQKYNPKAHNHQVILFGEKGDDGLVSTVREHEECMKRLQGKLDKYEENINKIVWLIGSTLIVALLNLVLKIGG